MQYYQSTTPIMPMHQVQHVPGQHLAIDHRNSAEVGCYKTGRKHVFRPFLSVHVGTFTLKG